MRALVFPFFVIPAQAGISPSSFWRSVEIPAFAGMTGGSGR